MASAAPHKRREWRGHPSVPGRSARVRLSNASGQRHPSHSGASSSSGHSTTPADDAWDSSWSAEVPDLGGAPASDTSVLDREGADTSTSRTNGRSQLRMGRAGSPLMTARSTFVSTHVKELPAALACILAASGRQRLRCGTPGCDRTPAIVCAACDTALGWCMVCDDNRHSRPVVLHRRVHLATGEVLAVGPVCGTPGDHPPLTKSVRVRAGPRARLTHVAPHWRMARYVGHRAASSRPEYECARAAPSRACGHRRTRRRSSWSACTVRRTDPTLRARTLHAAPRRPPSRLASRLGCIHRVP